MCLLQEDDNNFLKRKLTKWEKWEMNKQKYIDYSCHEEKLTNEQLKSIELNILGEIKRVCSANNLKFYLCGGTLLGAIRHKGFIPWDDDIDIYMPREDYNKFITLFNEYSDLHYKFMCMENSSKYCLPYGKVVCTDTILIETCVKSTPGMGVYVDVFPLDGLGDSLDEAKSIILKCVRYRALLGWAISENRKATPTNILKNVFCQILFLSRRVLYSQYLKTSQKNSFANSKYIAFCGAYYGEREILEHDIFSAFEFCEFEKELYPIPIGYDTYLRKLYGNYMLLPPIEKRVAHHSFVAYYKEREK